MTTYRTWAEFFEAEAKKPYFQELMEFMARERLAGKVYPPEEDVFRAFDLCPLEKVKVVILGQDPYHGPGQANGLAFSVREGVVLPPSLKNIFRELDSDWYELIRQSVRRACDHVNRNGDYIRSDGVSGLPSQPSSGDLASWANQGVFLFNRGLTVKEGLPGSHLDEWHQFAEAVLDCLFQLLPTPYFILWGSPAKDAFYDACRRTGVYPPFTSSPHPAARPPHISKFFGSRPFSKANEVLIGRGQSPIDWRLP